MRFSSAFAQRGAWCAIPVAAATPLALWPDAAAAHVKWFAPYIVGAAPAPVSNTLTNAWFWLAIALVLVFFMATRLLEERPAGVRLLGVMDQVSDPLWTRLDDFVRIVIGAFFVAIFAVGGVYLTPDLKTPSEWISWVQLLIAAGVVSRKTMPLSALGILGLWLLALRDYDPFHLLDYFALGVAVSGYLVLGASDNPDWRKYRFEVLRWGVAIALMWSSLEKFAYPEWFFPLVEEKPFLTFGMPRDVFIPMAGVAEFTMGFGLLWTPLVRRLSALALFVIFNAAVYPFGRIDLVGHALIMAIIVVIAADHTRALHVLPRLRRALWGVPVGLMAAIVLFVSAYWGLHAAFYGPNAPTMAQLQEQGVALPRATHSYSVEHPHGPQAEAVGGQHGGHGSAGGRGGMQDAGGAALPSSASDAYAASMDGMHEGMMAGMAHPDPDVAFVLGMIPHHQGAIDMAKVQLRFGSDPQNRALAEQIIAHQEAEIAAMRAWLSERGVEAP